MGIASFENVYTGFASELESLFPFCSNVHKYVSNSVLVSSVTVISTAASKQKLSGPIWG
jgi:hypothetical protein